MKFEDAIVESIKGFLKGKMPKTLSDLSEEGLTYGPEWFDAFEETVKNDGKDVVTPKKEKKEEGLGGFLDAK